MIAQLFPQGQSALQLVGGLYKLGMSTEEDLRWVKKEFVSAWKSWKAPTLALKAAPDSSYITQGLAKGSDFNMNALV